MGRGLAHLPGPGLGGGSGYLMVFRELHNPDAEHTVALHGVAGRSLTLTDLLTGEARQATATDAGGVTLRVPDAPGFLFVKYAIGD